ncbi:MAG TPA: AAA family ATPase [Microbacteriaceae bacterium]|nr:AAA family ATPase [Microbacteriaceae bacterium]
MSADTAPEESGDRFWTGPVAGRRPQGDPPRDGLAGPSLTVFVGPAGSGKSSLALAYARHRHAVYLDKDALASPLVGALLDAVELDPAARDESEFYTDQVMALEYEGMLAVAGDNLRLGREVVLDAPFAKYLADPGFMERTSRAHRWPVGLPLLVVQVSVPADVRRERLRRRGLRRDTWKLENWERHESSAAAECRWRGARVVDYDNSRDTIDLAALEDALALS